MESKELQQEIELLLDTAHAAYFSLSFDRMKGPSTSAILFHNEYDGRKVYQKLMDWAGNKGLTMSIFRRNNKIDISLVKTSTADAINFKNLDYSPERFNEFCKGEPQNTVFVFMCANNELRMLINQPHETPFLIKGYSVN